MEGLNHYGQEEYIWAMRTSTYRHSDTNLFRDLTASQSEFRSKSKTQSAETSDDSQTRVMASLVPDEVINNLNDYSHRQYDACFLFGDVSGFTELCEKYTKTGVSGPSRMTQVLNKYLGSMVQEVMSHNGDVLKFSGDAFLAVFKSTETESMRDAVHESLDCALVIQKNYGSYLTDVGVVIRVKLAISAGLVTFALIGTETTSHYVVVGKPIWDVKAAEHISSAGDIIVAPAAWHYVNTTEYHYEDMPDNVHVKILGVGPNWRSVQKNIRQNKGQISGESSREDSSSSDSDVLSELTQEGVVEEFALRPAVNIAVRNKIKENLRRFIFAPVMKSIDMQEPFDYLTEMRQAVIVFINVVSLNLATAETVVLADQTYKTVCRIVDKMKGCVNKVSLFDKDLMFVVIFGLRGLKHELECQAALRCAKECQTDIQKLPGVLSASIGVTTGKTYCGVFGHTLRREYTVIGLIVNKAARLMVAYKGKVSCDRQTFLHSKLEARHFILQEYKPLKGISNPGPVYEFDESERDQDMTEKINACPLLGGKEKIMAYYNILFYYKSVSPQKQILFKMFLIQGEARQGKTRLLDELMFNTPADIPVNRISLKQSKQNVPYHATRLLFDAPLGITPETTQKEKESKLLKMLTKVPVPELICLLNDVFEVNFPKTDVYSELSEGAKIVARAKMVKQLAFACFPILWVFAIDDFENIDPPSWGIFKELFNLKNIFVVATICKEKIIETKISEEIVRDKRVKVFLLKPIARRHLGALICQILGVYAISPELENVVQNKSNGNPGWIESYLISLIHDNALYIMKATLEEVNDLGLVSPPLYMMVRMTKDETRKWQNVMEERMTGEEMQFKFDNWQKFVDTCRDSRLNVTVRGEMEAIEPDGKVPICVVSPKFSVTEEETELSLDTMMLKAFDSLSYFEQLLVKCSAILGNQFTREMLLYVMNATDRRKAALAVQKLFEIRVLTCAKGDFIEGDRIYKERLIDPNTETELQCQCKGIPIDVACKDLPRYASCGYLQFRSSDFRDLTYNLLTDNQKKEFHQRAIRFLERETRRCKPCGSSYFERILGAKRDLELTVMRDQHQKTVDEDIASIHFSQRSNSIHSTSLSTPSTASKSKFDEKSTYSFVSHGTVTDFRQPVAMFGFNTINKLKNSVSLTRTFSQEEFASCYCHLILCTTYSQLIVHCMGAGDLTKALDAMLQYAELCITTNNIPLALKTLEQSIVVLRKKSQEKIENPWKLTLIKARIFILIGYARLELKHLEHARKNFLLALHEYGITFPKNVARRFKTLMLQLKQFYGLYLFPKKMTKNLDHWETIYANHLAECLTHLCTLFMIKNEWENAALAAVWSYCKSLESFSDFRLICTTAANMIHVAQHFERWKLCVALEVHALRLCYFKKQIEAEDLRCVCKLYGIIFKARLHSSNIVKAVHIGYVLLRIAYSIHGATIVLPLLPLLVYALLCGKRFNNASGILQEIDVFAEEDIDSSGKIWYYALSVGLQLETGYTVETYQRCENFYQYEGETWTNLRDTNAKKRFYTVMWLWCLRNEKWEQALIWCMKTRDFMSVSENDTLNNKISHVYLLEGMLLCFVWKLDRRNFVEAHHIERKIKGIFKECFKGSKRSRVLLPRLYHLKAYYVCIKENFAKATPYLIKASNLAQKQGNALEKAWIDHSTKAWTKNLPPDAIDFWKEHCEVDQMVDFADLETAEGMGLGFYTLPLPLYA